MNRFAKVVLTGALALSPIIGAVSVSAETAAPTDTLAVSSQLAVAAASADAKREKVVQTALSLKGQVQYVNWRNRQEAHAPYKTDCSGFTYLVYRLANVGVGLVNKDDDSQAKVGTKVAWGNFKKGDLIFFGNIGSSKSLSDVGHVGIYIGDGKMIHNANGSKDVVISDIYNSSYYKSRFSVARRVINDTQQSQPSPQPQPSTPQAKKQYVVTDHGWVGLKAAASLNSADMGRLQLGEKAELIKKANSYWYQVKVNGKTLYITTNSKYTKVITQ
ncbi:NlpC/P60 family protein [Paenibacillus sp. HJGM_3]|uniref:NlpC/P60 family protein n=1 Tax=Paenibacillus sp. HJGM_3 TaxID=3379816 RepID=UPI00385F41CA